MSNSYKTNRRPDELPQNQADLFDVSTQAECNADCSDGVLAGITHGETPSPKKDAATKYDQLSLSLR